MSIANLKDWLRDAMTNNEPIKDFCFFAAPDRILKVLGQRQFAKCSAYGRDARKATPEYAVPGDCLG